MPREIVSPFSSISSARSSAQSRPPARCGSAGGCCGGASTRRVLEQRERRHPGGDRRLERLAEERPERPVLPCLDVARAPVVEEDDAEDVVGERLRRHRLAEPARHADDEAELELDVEAAARPVDRRVGVRRLRLAGRADDVGAADDDRAGAPVVADGQPAPVLEQRLGVGPEETADVRRVLARGVEVDVVRDLERQPQARRGHRRPRPVVRARRGDRVLPGLPAGGEQRVQRRLRELVAQTGEVDRLVTFPPGQPAPGQRAEPAHPRSLPELR